MTSEVRTVIELSDITGIEFECHKCRARMVYPVEDAPLRLTSKCPNCFEPWLVLPDRPQRDETIDDQLKGWIAATGNLRKRQDVLVKIRLQLAPLST